jgi:glycogen debranching enzyme
MTVSANLTHTVVLKEGNAFLVSTPEGEIPLDGEHPLGLYRDDCRFLSGHELRVGGMRPRLLVTSSIAGSEAVHELTNPELELPGPHTLALQTLQIRLDRVLVDEATMCERVHVHLYGRDEIAIEVELALAADFVPMLMLRGMAGSRRAGVELTRVDGGVRFAARGSDGVLRATTVTADPPPAEVAGGSLRFGLHLAPGLAGDILLTYDLHQDRAEPPSPRRAGRPPARRRDGDSGRPAGLTRVRADDELFNRVLERSLQDLRMLRSQIDGNAYYAAGIPWFATLFGRDSLITAIETLAFDARMAEQTLRLLAGRLGRRVDPIHEEEPGKVLHELRLGEVANRELTPLARYYGTVDATPLFLSLIADHARWSGTLDLFRELRPAIDAALGWIDQYGDHDGDGLLDYRAGTPDGLRNQGWKDSDDGVLDERGAPLEPPIALVEVQGYVVRAKRGLARLFERDGDPRRAEALRREADEVQERLERYWLEGRGFYSMGIGGDGRASGALASNQGHLLWAGAVSADRGARVRDAVMGDAMFSGWGIRTLGRGEPGFNPVGYHLGTVWPHDTAMIAAGLRAYGHDRDFLAVFEALLEAASHADDYRLPELFAGFSRAQFEVPVPYPVACKPQAWAAGAIPYLMTSGLGLRAEGLDQRLVVRRPSLPSWVNRVEVEGLRVGDSSVDLLFERAGPGEGVALTDVRIDGDVEVALEIGAAPAVAPEQPS